jgi:hypothetical protein
MVPMAHCCVASRPTVAAAVHDARRTRRRGDFTDTGGGWLRARFRRSGGDTLLIGVALDGVDGEAWMG